ncbi:hypothetical protein dsx2_1204 [Desulfovibrio sp. X2]|uniref:DMT family transporter n=1 Tax=Desulfovibrio sp. X2 TaxID=941449 RepID=UPI0003589B9C|nr:multidrug resistance efflux transporter family protein [Desulfovibrio sp. X2]EPR37261.1 hypothetical protein dsx2_1204 [Desulfovibrio sp. X2]
MAGLVALGGLAALFFSSTFVLNRVMSLAGGHWFWSAGLRYAFMILLLCVLFPATGQTRLLRAAFAEWRRNLGFWSLAGGIGFGVFYSLLCYSAAYAPGWIVATTWQATILATPVVLLLFGKPVPGKGLICVALIFCGILMVNLEHAASVPFADLLAGACPVLVAALAYPLGNQMVWEARHGKAAGRRDMDHEVLDSSFGRVLLLSLGSLPFWLVLGALVRPPLPPMGQVADTFLVALLSGVAATSLFLAARHRARTSFEIAAVDATQSAEVLFTLLGEVLLLGAPWPGGLGLCGIALALLGLALSLRAREKTA